MKKIIATVILFIMSLTIINATSFKCNDYKRNLYVTIYQSSNGNSMTLYNNSGNYIDKLTIGKTKRGGTRFYGNRTTIYVYKNRKQFSIRTYNKRRNSVGSMFGVFRCR